MTKQKRNDIIDRYMHSIRHGGKYICFLCGAVLRINDDISLYVKERGINSNSMIAHSQCLNSKER